MAIVYTAIFGSIRDSLYEPQNLAPITRCHAYMGVKEVQHIAGWDIKASVWEHATNPRKRARRHKVLVHELYPDEEISLWVDGCLTPLTDPKALADMYLQDTDICMFRHMDRNCVFQELETCIKLRKDDDKVMRKQVDGYRKEGYPHNNGLAETTAVLRRHTPQIEQLNNRWWVEIRDKSIRDQLSIDFLCWDMGIKYSVFRGNRCRSPHFKWRAHR